MEDCKRYFVRVSGDLPPGALPNYRKILLAAFGQIPAHARTVKEYDIDIQHDLYCAFWSGKDCDCGPNVSVTELQ